MYNTKFKPFYTPRPIIYESVVFNNQISVGLAHDWFPTISNDFQSVSDFQLTLTLFKNAINGYSCYVKSDVESKRQSN